MRGISSATKKVAQDLLENANSAKPLVRRQFLDANQLQRLSLTLNRPSLFSDVSVKDLLEGPVKGTPIPPGYHLAYFTPAFVPHDLGPDGADISYNPPPPFTRRMWAGGKLTWRKENLLRVADNAVETTILVSSEAKRTRQGDEMIVVGVEKTFENSNGLALVDRRDWVFHRPMDAVTQSKELPDPGEERGTHLPEAESSTQISRDYLQTAVSLFRFSALTFNAHMIHYSKPWCQRVEGHPEIVVHGPLNLINMLDFWRDETSGDGYAIPSTIAYRATAPFYAGERYRALLELAQGESSVRLWRSDADGAARVGMLGDIKH